MCETTRRIVEHISRCKIQQKKSYHIVSYETLYTTHYFQATSESESILKQIEGNNDQSPYLATLDKRYLSGNYKNIEMLNVK